VPTLISCSFVPRTDQMLTTSHRHYGHWTIHLFHGLPFSWPPYYVIVPVLFQLWFFSYNFSYSYLIFYFSVSVTVLWFLADRTRYWYSVASVVVVCRLWRYVLWLNGAS